MSRRQGPQVATRADARYPDSKHLSTSRTCRAPTGTTRLHRRPCCCDVCNEESGEELLYGRDHKDANAGTEARKLHRKRDRFRSAVLCLLFTRWCRRSSSCPARCWSRRCGARSPVSLPNRAGIRRFPASRAFTERGGVLQAFLAALRVDRDVARATQQPRRVRAAAGGSAAGGGRRVRRRDPSALKRADPARTTGVPRRSACEGR